MHEVQQRLRALQSLPPIAVPVTRLAWMRYDTAVVGGRLRTLSYFDLGSGGLRVAGECGSGSADA
ncbi:MAG TPA: hypothetical protein PLO41_15380, partial [Rubrivivax sp.]|nr:hypothetical protein [Rubrivivax sp.]